MNTRPLVAVCILVFTFASARGGFVSGDERKPESGEDRQKPDLEASPGAAQSRKPMRENMEKEKVLLNRLVTELEQSARSFIYLRSAGFTESDEAFERLISTNNTVFRSVRIVRRDERGKRQIPGWPGIALTPEYSSAKR